MILHLGDDAVIRLKDVVMILDLSTGAVSRDTQAFLAGAKEQGIVRGPMAGEQKSCVLARVNGQTRLYYSPISALTLQKRSAMYG